MWYVMYNEKKENRKSNLNKSLYFVISSQTKFIQVTLLSFVSSEVKQL